MAGGGFVSAYFSEPQQRILRISPFVSLLMPLILHSRRNRRPNEGAAAELQLNRRLDMFFEQVLRAELFMIRSGLNFPMGDSLLLVAKKIREL